jgi:hypothetical protein
MTRRPFSNSERFVLGSWLAICALVLAMMTYGSDPPLVLAGVAGLVMLGVGVFILLNITGVAQQLAARRVGLGPIWFRLSAAFWRFTGGFVAVIGAVWSLALI